MRVPQFLFLRSSGGLSIRTSGLIVAVSLAVAGCQSISLPGAGASNTPSQNSGAMPSNATTRPASPAGVVTGDGGAVATPAPSGASSGSDAAVGVPPAPPPVALPLRAPRVCLALGGGAARGFAHIGVIQVLEEAGIRTHCVAGTSAGSLVAALYATGRTGSDLAKLAIRMDESAITDWSFPGRGVIRGEALARYVRQHTGGKLIEQLPMPLGIVATDLNTGDGVLFRRGDVGQAVRASSAVPAVFQPVSIQNREYVDGGLVAPVPVRYAREMGADVVVAVDISTPPEGQATGDAFSLLLQTFSIMGKSINQLELRQADVVIRPALAGVGSADFTARQKAISAGRAAAQQQLPALRERMRTWSLSAAAAS